MTKADRAQFSCGDQFQLRLAPDGLDQTASLRDIFPNRFPKCRKAVIAKREPQLQRPKSARQFQRLLKKREALNRIFRQRPCILPAMRESLPGILERTV